MMRARSAGGGCCAHELAGAAAWPLAKHLFVTGIAICGVTLCLHCVPHGVACFLDIAKAGYHPACLPNLFCVTL